MHRFCEKCGTAATSHVANVCSCGGAIKMRAETKKVLVVDSPSPATLALLRRQYRALNEDDSGNPDEYARISAALAEEQLKRPSSR